MAMANQPTPYELSGNGIHVTYATSSLQGQPQFNYRDAFQAKNFTGNQIQTADTVLGRLVTVFLVQTIDSGSTTFHAAGPDRELAAVESRQHHDGRHYDPAQIRDRQTAAGDRPSFIPSTSSTARQGFVEFWVARPRRWYFPGKGRAAA